VNFLLLLVCATELEMKGLPQTVRLDPRFSCLVSGVGLVEATLALSGRLLSSESSFDAVINFGVGGAYPGSGMELLDICLAEKEMLGDLGIQTGDDIVSLPEHLPYNRFFKTDPKVLSLAHSFLDQTGIQHTSGPFITVGCASGTSARGGLLSKKYNGICENMEGAALARVCQEFSIPFFELRCISNRVEDRHAAGWRLQEAADKAAVTAGLVASHLLDS
jgi:futalosine hydrolase